MAACGEKGEAQMPRCLTSSQSRQHSQGHTKLATKYATHTGEENANTQMHPKIGNMCEYMILIPTDPQWSIAFWLAREVWGGEGVRMLR